MTFKRLGSALRSIGGWWNTLPVQVLGLALVAVLVAQGVNLVVVFNTPPPRIDAFEIEEIADAVRLYPSTEARLRVRSRASEPDLEPEDFREAVLREELAAALGVAHEDVRIDLAMGQPVPGWPIAWPLRQPRRDPPSGPSFTSLPSFSTAVRALGALPPRPRRPLIGEFTAAIRQTNGSWLSVTPASSSLMNTWRVSMFAWFLGTTAIIAPLGYAFARRLTAPIRSFAMAAERLGRNPDAPLLEIDRGPAEIIVASRAFNEMQQRVQRYVRARTEMLGALAHDLRTPLMRLAFRIENAPPEARHAAMGDIQQMKEMIEALLTFVRDASDPERREPIDLQSLLESVAESSTELSQPVDVDDGDRLVTNGNPVALKNLVTNLVDNAIKYGVRARARVYRSNGSAVIEIDDEGPGLAADDLERVFEPFYRSEQSRNRDTGGIGLGLSIVRMIAHAHGGDVVLMNRPEGGLRARVSLPI